MVVETPQPLDFLIVHPPISTGALVGLYNSTNSSFAPLGPLVLNSLITIVVATCMRGAARTGTRTVPASPVNKQASRNTKNSTRMNCFRYFMNWLQGHIILRISRQTQRVCDPVMILYATLYAIVQRQAICEVIEDRLPV